MGFFDSISQALGTDGGNSGLLPSVSNALGTDGSKNGLLHDPLSMAAVAGGAAYLSGGLSLAGTAPAAAAPEGLSLAASDSAFNAAILDSSTGAASGLSIPWGSIGAGAASVGQALLPLLPMAMQTGAQKNNHYANGLTPLPTYGVVHDTQLTNGAWSPSYATNNQAGQGAGLQLSMPMLACLAMLAFLALKK